MKNQLNKNLIKLAGLLSVAVLTSCGTSKSTTGTTDLSSSVVVDATKPLASCNNVFDTNLSMNIANVINTDGKADLNWVKLQFKFLNADLAQTGYNIRFYKWRVINNTTQLDQVPLSFYSYSFSSNQPNSEVKNAVFATEINAQNGFYLNLNDDVKNPYQVLKVVVYKTDGSVAASSNVLIPQFLANPEDYKLNPDGSPRNELLQHLHPLYGTDIAGLTGAQIQEKFDQHCF